MQSIKFLEERVDRLKDLHMKIVDFMKNEKMTMEDTFSVSFFIFVHSAVDLSMRKEVVLENLGSLWDDYEKWKTNELEKRDENGMDHC